MVFPIPSDNYEALCAFMRCTPNRQKRVPTMMLAEQWLHHNYFTKGIFDWEEIKKTWASQNFPASKKNSKSQREFQKNCRLYMRALNDNPWISLGTTAQGVGVFCKKDIPYDLDTINDFFRAVQSNLFRADIPKHNSRVSYKVKALGALKAETEVGILYGPMSFMNNHCRAAISLREPIFRHELEKIEKTRTKKDPPFDINVAIMDLRLFRYSKSRKRPLYLAGEEITIRYTNTEIDWFDCECTYCKRKSKSDRQK